MTILTSAQFDLAFTFARSEAAQHRNGAGALVTAAVDAPRFDHDIAGAPLGFLTGVGADLGGGDRVAIDPLMLPAALLTGELPGDRDATVFHRFDTGSGEQRRAWYSRDVTATIAALLHQAGHHLELGVVAGFRRNEDGRTAAGFVRYRGEVWQLPELLGVTGGVLADLEDRPLIRAGADPSTGVG